MHTLHTQSERGATTFHYNGDFGGMVDIVEVGPKGERVNLVNVDTAHVEQFVAEKYRMLLISALEEMDLSQPGSVTKIVRLWGNAQTMLRVY